MAHNMASLSVRRLSPLGVGCGFAGKGLLCLMRHGWTRGWCSITDQDPLRLNMASMDGARSARRSPQMACISHTPRHLQLQPRRPLSSSSWFRSQHLGSPPESTPTRQGNASDEASIKLVVSTHDSASQSEIATITVKNPLKLNALDSNLLDQLYTTITTLPSTAHHLRAVILTGAAHPRADAAASSAFIGGANIAEMQALGTAAAARAFITRIHDVCGALRALPVPVLARIDGFCLGAGLEIAAACDLRAATRRSVFAMPEVRVGIPSVVEARLLPGLVGWGRARRLCLLGETLGAARAETWGLIDEAVDGPLELDALVSRWVDVLVANGPKALESQKRLFARWEEVSGVEMGVELGIEAFAEMWEDGGTEPKEMMARFWKMREEEKKRRRRRKQEKEKYEAER